MEGTQAAAEPAGGGPQKPKTGSRTTSPMPVTSVAERNDPEPQADNGLFSRPWPFPPPKPPRLYRMQLHGPSVLESKVRALKEKMTAGKQGVSPTTHEQSSPKKSKCQRVKPGRDRISEDSSLAESVVLPNVQNLPGGQLGSSVNKEELTRNGGSRPLPSAPELECWNGQSPLPPEVVRLVPGCERDLPPGPDSSAESPSHGISPGWPAESGPCKTACIPSLKKGRPDSLQDGLVTVGDLDSTSPIPEKAFVPRTAPLGTLWKARDLGALGTGGNALSLTDQVERNRLLLQEMLKVSEQSSPKVAPPAWAPSGDRTAPERPARDMGWESGISLQDSEQNRTFGPKPEDVLSTRQEEAKHLLQHSRMKARTRPLRASHDIVPTIAPGSRDNRRSPALGPRMTFACGDSLQSWSLSDFSSRESSSGQWPKRGLSPSHVRFEDEPAYEAEFRHLKRRQQCQHQVLSTVLQAAGQGPLRSKPDLADYVNQKVGMGTFHRLGESQDCRGHALLPPSGASERKCQACSHCPERQRPDPRVLEELPAAYGVQGTLCVSHSSDGLSSPFQLLAEPGLHTERLRETHIGETTTCAEEGDSALDSTDTSDGCRTDGEEAGTSLPNRTGRQTRGSSPRQWDSRPQGGLRWSRKAKAEVLCGLQAWRHSLGVDDMEVGDEVKEVAGHRRVGIQFLKEDAFPKPPPLEPEMAFLGSQRQPGPGLENNQANPVDSRAPCKPPCAATSSMKLAPSRPGRADQVTESNEYLATVHTSSLQQNHAHPTASNPTQQPATSSPEGRVSSRTTSPVSRRNAEMAGPCRPGEQEETVGIPLPLSPPRTVVLRACGLSPPQTQPSVPQVRHPLPGLSSNNRNSCIPVGQQEPWEMAVHRARQEREPCSQEPDPPLENSRDGGHQGPLGLADVATFNSVAITLTLTSEEPESCQEAEEGLQRAESSSGRHMLSGASPEATARPRPPSAAPSDRNKKRSSIASTLGLKKLFSALGQTSRPKFGKSRSHSVEHLQPDTPGSASHTSAPKVKRAPSLQSFHLVSPSRQHQKAASFQNLHSLLSGKGNRSSLYLVEGPEYPSTPGRPAKAPPRRALSVEDVGAPSLARTVGRVVAVFPDGTSMLQLQRSPAGTFGFRVGSGNGRRDSGLYVQEMADLDTAKLYSGLLGVGDEILEVNGAKVAGLGLAYIKELLTYSENLSVRVLRQRPVLR